MKRLFLIFVFLFFPSQLWAATYYVRQAGTNADTDCSGSSPCCAGAMDMSDLMTAADSFTDNDIIYFCDDDNSGVFRSTLRCWSDGSSSGYVTYMAYPGDTVIIRGSDLVAVGDWNADGSDWYWQPPQNGAGTTRIEPMQVWEDESRLTWKEWLPEYTQTDTDDFWWAKTNLCQEIKGATTVTKVKLLLYYQTAATDVHLEAWSDNAMAGVQYGTDSQTVSVSTTDSGGKEYTFYFGTDPTPPGDWFLHIVPAVDDRVICLGHTDETKYEDTNYDCNRDGVDLDVDLVFKIYESKSPMVTSCLCAKGYKLNTISWCPTGTGQRDISQTVSWHALDFFEHIAK